MPLDRLSPGGRSPAQSGHLAHPPKWFTANRWGSFGFSSNPIPLGRKLNRARKRQVEIVGNFHNFGGKVRASRSFTRKNYSKGEREKTHGPYGLFLTFVPRPSNEDWGNPMCPSGLPVIIKKTQGRAGPAGFSRGLERRPAKNSGLAGLAAPSGGKRVGKRVGTG